MLRARVALLAAAAALVGGLVAAAPSVQAAAPPSQPTFVDTAGIHVVSAIAADDRLWQLVVTTPALAGFPVKINVLLPAGYAQRSARRYPVLYLFHGTSGNANDWLTMGSAEQTTAGLPMITVIPDAGFNSDGGGWFTNWIDQQTALGPSQWTTFDIDQLIPFVDYTLKTISARSGRAVAGLSQGGYGSFSLAARYPDLFSVAGSFSGAPDIGTNPEVEAGGRAIIDATEVGLDGGVEPDAAFGSPATYEINYQGHNPGTLVTNLAYTDLLLWTGNGEPGPYDDPTNPGGLPGGASIEAAAHTSTLSFANVAAQAGVGYTLDDYGPGTHSWPYWTRDLQQFVGPLMQAFAHPAPKPATVSYESVEQVWTQWGWTVANHRTVTQAWSALTSASAGGFGLTGTGRATVTTPANYHPRRAYRVTTITADGTTRVTHVRASRTGRLVLTVPLAAESPESPVLPATPTTVTIG